MHDLRLVVGRDPLGPFGERAVDGHADNLVPAWVAVQDLALGADLDDTDGRDGREHRVPLGEGAVASLGLDEGASSLLDSPLELDAHEAELEVDAYPCEQLACLERLGEVVVDASLESFGARLGSGLSGDHDDRDKSSLRVAADDGRELATRDVGHHGVGLFEARSAQVGTLVKQPDAPGQVKAASS